MPTAPDDVVDDDLTIKASDYDQTIDMRMSLALSKLLVHLGSAFFRLDLPTNEFLPTATAREICKAIETGHGVSAQDLTRASSELLRITKKAYDKHVLLIRANPGASFLKVLP